jgi:cell wall-associated NlpC family hydrolase
MRHGFLFHILDERGISSRVTLVVIVALVGFIFLRSVTSHAAPANAAAIKSGISGYCLDDHTNSTAPGAVVDSWGCNDTSAQDWTVGVGLIKHDNSCLSVKSNGTVVGDSIELKPCVQASGQVWLRDKTGFENPNSRLCLSLPNGQTGQQLVLASCSYLSQDYESWVTSQTPDCSTQASEGEKVACYAEQEWTRWQSGVPSHETLLTAYTGGAPYEEWCADFVSYVYKEAGYPFSNGNYDGWDENIAPDIQYMGFNIHDAGSYNPQPGDVAFFDYAGGHVEIVVSGGKSPTFIYGDSATIDPATGNGDMEANTITSMGSEGNVVYYMSPQ